ncbi:MAG: anthranilate synthase component I [Candidatus Omnitrophica bacterium]|nr:anthranilate synthase component I [Candidatus Omnitrophota bacterium]
MIYPDYKNFNQLAKKGNLVAVTMSIPADLETPVSCFLKLADRAPHAFLLESAEQEEKIGRFSFIGVNPEAIFIAERGRVKVTEARKTYSLRSDEHLLDHFAKRLASFKLANPEALPGFCGGFVGYFGYENVEHFETVRLSAKKGSNIPDAVFFLAQEFLIFDHFRKSLSITILADVNKPMNLKKTYAKALRRIDKALALIQKPLKTKLFEKPRSMNLKSHLSRRQFEQKIDRIKNYIRAGDCIQVVLSQRFSTASVKNDFQIYRALRSINPSPYMFYFRAKKFRLIGSSPELLVKKTGRMAEVRPIAGTRPRGKTPAADMAFEERLKKSSKEMAEHLMLVDLGRNDLGRVCEFDSIRVKNFARVERYSHVMHLVSDVTGKLKSGKTCFDLLKATFPAGTVTGAPKIRAMQIIDELETERRGPYAGCLGYFSFNQDMDMCITIRTLVIDGKKIYLQAGAGIVKDSNPGREYQETLNKAKALFRALQIQGNFSNASGHR